MRQADVLEAHAPLKGWRHWVQGGYHSVLFWRRRAAYIRARQSKHSKAFYQKLVQRYARLAD